jgi:hypothetical protein
MIRTASDRFAVPVLVRIGVGLSCAAIFASRADAQPVALRISPPVGETVRMRLDQRVEMSGTTRMAAGDSTATVVTTLFVLSRAFVERRERDATVLLTWADSVVASSNGADSLVVATETRQALQGRRVRLRISPDGATEIVGKDAAASPELNALFSQMPATLPNTPVAAGQSWSRVMLAPIDPAIAGAGSGGKLQATFTLDSLSKNGESAYVSIVGTLSRAPSSKDGRATLTMSGSVNGSLVLDRRRGWINDARMSYIVRSVLTPTGGSTAAAMRFRMKVTQWVRAVP